MDERLFREILYNERIAEKIAQIGEIAAQFDYPVVRQRRGELDVTSVVELSLRHLSRDIASRNVRGDWEAYSEFYNDVKSDAKERGVTFSESMIEAIDHIGQYMEEQVDVNFHYIKRGEVYNRKLVVICALCYTADTLES